MIVRKISGSHEETAGGRIDLMDVDDRYLEGDYPQ